MSNTPQTPEENPNEKLGTNEVQPNSGDNVRASWNFSLHDVRTNMAKCTPDRKQIMIDCFLWCIDAKHPVTLHEFAKLIGYDRTTVWKVYTGKYVKVGTNERLDVPEVMAKKAVSFLAGQKLHYRGREEFVVTPTARRIWQLADLVRESHTVGFVAGRSHIGKTWALERYSSDHNHGGSPFIRMKAASGLGGMVRHITTSVGVSDKGNTMQLIQYIKGAVTADMLLMFDELHLLMYTYRIGSFFACLEVLREIKDETGCGMLLCGTQLLMEKIRGGQHTEMEQLVRRGVHKLQLPDMPTKGDLTAILHHNGLEFPDRKLSVSVQGISETPFDVLKQLAKMEGLLSICERLRYAQRFATKAGEEIGWKHFIEAHLTIAANNKPQEDW